MPLELPREAREELRRIAIGAAGVTGVLAWFTASNAKNIADSLALPLMAAGCLGYLLLARPTLDWAHAQAIGGRPVTPRGTARWQNWPDAVALVAIAAFENSQGPYYLLLTLFLMGLAFFVIGPEWGPERRVKREARHLARSFRVWIREKRLGPEITYLLVSASVVVIPGVLLFFVVPIGIFERAPDLFPRFAASTAWCLVFTFGLTTARALIRWISPPLRVPSGSAQLKTH